MRGWRVICATIAPVLQIDVTRDASKISRDVRLGVRAYKMIKNSGVFDDAADAAEALG